MVTPGALATASRTCRKPSASICAASITRTVDPFSAAVCSMRVPVTTMVSIPLGSSLLARDSAAADAVAEATQRTSRALRAIGSLLTPTGCAVLTTPVAGHYGRGVPFKCRYKGAFSQVGRRGTEVLFPVRGQWARPPNERRDGRSPGSPISACGRLPGEISSGFVAASFWLTVAGTAPDLHRVPFWPPFGQHHLLALWELRGRCQYFRDVLEVDAGHRLDARLERGLER